MSKNRAAVAKMIRVGPADLAEGEMRGFEIGDRMVLLARTGGRCYAIDDWCNHAGCLLSGGRMIKSVVICPCHEVGFDLATGKVATQPRICDDQRRFTLEERDGALYVDLDELKTCR